MSHPALNRALRESERASRAQRERTSSHRSSRAGAGLAALQGRRVVCTACGDHLPIGAMLRSESGPVCLPCEGTATASLELEGAWKTETTALLTRLLLSALGGAPGPALMLTALLGSGAGFKTIAFGAVVGLWGVVGHPLVAVDTVRRTWKLRARLVEERQGAWGAPALAVVAGFGVASAPIGWALAAWLLLA